MGGGGVVRLGVLVVDVDGLGVVVGVWLKQFRLRHRKFKLPAENIR